MTAAPTSRELFHTELTKIASIAAGAGFLVPHAIARAANVGTAQMRAWLKGASDPGNPWARDQVLMDIVNTLQIRPVAPQPHGE
jgi:hypothetical protein